MTVEEYTVNCLLGVIPGRTVASSESLAEKALNRVRRHIAQANRLGQNGRIIKSHWNIGFVQAQNEYVRSFERAMLGVLGHRKRSYVLSFCDATYFYCAGIPTILFGPGKMDLGHSTGEYTSIPQVKDATSVLARSIEDILTQN
jgi:acetylornithine deacetylase/succinyl-diaminopimelate desuccinylase-like protein